MGWRNNPPIRSDYETDEEYEDAADAFLDAIEAYYEERLLNKEN